MASPLAQLLCLFLLFVSLTTKASSLPVPLLEHHTIHGVPFPSTTNTTTKIIDPTLPSSLPSTQHEFTPICSLPILQFNLTSSATATTPSIFSSNYTAPDPNLCNWTQASLHISAYANGSASPDHLASVFLHGVELLRTATPVPTAAGVAWTFQRDVTRYSSTLSRDGRISMALSTSLDQAEPMFLKVNATLSFHGAAKIQSVVGRELRSDNPDKLHLLYGKPADTILPLSSRTPEEDDQELGFSWSRILDENDEFLDAITIPSNTRRAVLEIYVSGHASDEFWYAKPPNYLPGGRGSGPIRQATVTVDGLHVGSSVPFPAVYSGGVNPLLWTPIAPVESFVLPSHDIELTPILGKLLDGGPHVFAMRITGALPFWLVGANLHLWLDPNPAGVSARLTGHKGPSFSYSTKTKTGSSLWKFQVERERDMKLSGWVASSLGNLTTEVKEEVEVEGEVSFKSDGASGTDVEEVEFKAKYKREVKVVEGARNELANMKQKTKFPVKIKTAVAAVGNGTHRRSDVKVSRGLEEKVKVKTYGGMKTKSEVKNKEEGEGWMVAEGKSGPVFDGSASTEHEYSIERSGGVGGCYERKVKVKDGVLVEDLVPRKTCTFTTRGSFTSTRF